MRNEFHEEIHDDEVEQFVKSGLTKAVEAEGERLARIENHVMETLRNRPQRRSIFDWLKLPSLPMLRPALAFAAGAAIFILGIGFGLVLQNNGIGTSDDQGILFVVAYPEAQNVELAGDFTKWNPVSLTRQKDGIWSIKMDLTPGRHEYVFIVDGERKVIDPRADEYVKSYSHINSVIFVTS